ncbi:MAG TPA: chalcone isomerase family protein [Bryobacteraceae bacterium]|nr:chalcone isomerase family protein [Bryobacteraceae bacterium]
MKGRSLIAPTAFCCAVALSVAADHVREASGRQMPRMVGVAGRELQLNGMGVAKGKVFFKVYVAGLYLEKPTADARSAITTDEAKRIVLVMLRDVSRETFVKAVTGILRNSSRSMPTLRARLDLLEQALPAPKKGNMGSRSCSAIVKFNSVDFESIA